MVHQRRRIARRGRQRQQACRGPHGTPVVARADTITGAERPSVDDAPELRQGTYEVTVASRRRPEPNEVAHSGDHRPAAAHHEPHAIEDTDPFTKRPAPVHGKPFAEPDIERGRAARMVVHQPDQAWE